MKKLFALLLVLLVFAGPVKAEPVDLSGIPLPNAKGGCLYLPEEDRIEAATMLTILSYKLPNTSATFDLDAIYAIDNIFGAGIALELGSLADVPGITFPLAQFVDVSIGVAGIYDNNQEHRDDKLGWGLYGNLIKVQF